MQISNTHDIFVLGWNMERLYCDSEKKR